MMTHLQLCRRRGQHRKSHRARERVQAIQRGLQPRRRHHFGGIWLRWARQRRQSVREWMMVCRALASDHLDCFVARTVWPGRVLSCSHCTTVS